MEIHGKTSLHVRTSKCNVEKKGEYKEGKIAPSFYPSKLSSHEMNNMWLADKLFRYQVMDAHEKTFLMKLSVVDILIENTGCVLKLPW